MASKPNIRFNDFSDDWEEIELNEISERITRKNSNLESTLPLTISAQYGLVDQRDFFNTQIASKDVSGYFLLKKGEFAYNKSYSSEYPFGTIKRLDKYEMGVLSTLYILFSHKNINSDFLLHYYDSNYWHNEITKIAAEGVRNHGLLNIAPEDFFNTKLKVTKNENEQKVIGLFFTQITSLIDSTQEKLDKAIILKKSMLEKMFPKNGAKVPELRFSGFNDNWKVNKLSNYLEVVTDKNESELYGKESVLSVSGDYGVVNQIEHQGKSLAGASLINYGVVHTGDVVYTKSPLKEQPYGIIKTNKGKTGIVSALYGIFRKKGEIITDFIQYYFESDRRLNEYLRPLVNKGAKNTLLVSDEDSIKGVVSIPSIKEQEIIIKYFDECSRLITNYRNELEKLKTIKKSLLEKMFV